MSLVSVIIPTHNRANFIERAVCSVLAQSYTQLEVLVVDDGSTDNTVEVVAGLAESDDRVRLLRHGVNRGAQVARNTGIQAARGQYLAFLDSDNEWFAEKLFLQMQVFSLGTASLGAVYCGFRRIYSSGRPVSDHMPKYRGLIYASALREWIADTSTLLVRKEFLDQAGPFPETVRANQEWDLCIRLASVCEFDFVPECLVYYHIHSSPAISKDLLRSASGYLDIIEAHRDEILRELGPRHLANHYFMAGQQFIAAGRFDLARRSFLRSLRVLPAQFKPLLYFTATLIGKKNYEVLRLRKKTAGL